MTIGTLVLPTLLLLALLGVVNYDQILRRSRLQIPQLQPLPQPLPTIPRVAVIIPVYNEAENLRDCLSSILQSTSLSTMHLNVWVVDDQSTDGTGAIAQQLQQEWADPRLHLLPGQPRPTDTLWMGKNWACAQGAAQARGEYLLFLDADVRLQTGAIEAAVLQADQNHVDLLSCGPQVLCGCLAEWLVQPLLFNQLLIGLDWLAINTPNPAVVFAAGPFMLFRRSAYEEIGGHRGVADQVVEDVELARRIKQAGLQFQLMLAPALVTVRMYRSWAALWEGWTKNLYLGAQRQLSAMVTLILIMAVIYVLPWIGLGAIALKMALTHSLVWIDGVSLALLLAAIAGQYDLRRLGAEITQGSSRYWWLTGLGGLLVAAIALGSVIKTETGWGWTWRGRPLQLPQG
ncbi:hypothetical protein DO97_17880 [Neosynechococcus sphagnicola sy1]|uniref:Glycosyltransferase 2-like domain-containing protein n=1 Tax=Neosynechococcus sphagnicola sy1 TaxID=1497020 RepID=A0A098THS4_9CYAN|nr:glycosyltransferase family 2 protein [Neosynechococcus sphagnicola]KGF71537.1 hypothetical protein DO97_17880 [Neosynechococcus sphagnicola sy1]